MAIMDGDASMSAPQLSLDRYKTVVRRVFDLLSNVPEGMTTYEIYKASGYPRSSVVLALQDNLLFYVDRWALNKHSLPTRVWMAADLKRFDDCPRPDDMK